MNIDFDLTIYMHDITISAKKGYDSGAASDPIARFEL